ncbi:MAG: proteinase inhibitor I4 serpin [Planctomycetes bacterium]|nr:proteinase inhibitor I4 serpin [Planctomycetota bacterium]
MKRAAHLLLLIAALTAASAPAAERKDPLEAYPPAAEGMSRYVLQLPPEDDESRLRVELIVGKTVETDKINRYFFGGKIERSTVEGWGYPRYDVEELGPLAGTLMAPPSDAPKVERFIALGGEPYLIRYNSKLPVVVYVPEDAEVRYRIWRAPADATAMPQG